MAKRPDGKTTDKPGTAKVAKANVAGEMPAATVDLPAPGSAPEPRPVSLRARLSALYFADGPVARHFRYGMLAFDLFTIAIFIVSSFMPAQGWILWVDFAIALVLIVELAARVYVSANRRRHIFSLATALDVVVIASLLAPAVLSNLGFLRIVRALRVLRSFHLLRDLRADFEWYRVYEDAIQRSISLFVFVFVVSSIVFVTQSGSNKQIVTYMDALYFTATTLTTTGFGDITLQGDGGRLLAIIIMVVGVSLFLRLLQALFRPHKVRFECHDCGLLFHDSDAVHCKHCGKVLRIPSEGHE
jgi:voltage-gated potassium channel